MVSFEKTVLITREAIASRVYEMAQWIQTDYHNNEIVLLGLLKGSIFFLSDLVKPLAMPVEIGFLYLSSYQGQTTPQSSVRNLNLPLPDLTGRHVIIVDEIFDTGATLSYAYKLCQKQSPASLKTCVLLVKEGSEKKETPPIDYRGFNIPNVFVVGYGLDYYEKFRNLPDIMEMKFKS